MTRVVAIILHAVPEAGAGSLEAAFAAERAANARRLARGFEKAGTISRIVEVRPGGAPFGARLRRLAALDEGAGIIILGSGSLPLARPADHALLVRAAAAGDGPVLTNNRYSGDVLAIPAGIDLSALPDVLTDNGLPRWFEGRGAAVQDLRTRWHLQVDLDSPIDVLIAGRDPTADPTFDRLRGEVRRVRQQALSPGSELLVAGRTSAATLGWLEAHTASRTRAFVEERGMRTAPAGQRPARSALGLLLDRDGPEGLGWILAELAEVAVVDTRVLLAHRLGTDEVAWPAAEDRFASDLLLHERIADPWLRTLTRAVVEAPIPVLFGGHTLVGPGLRRLLGARSR